MELVRRESSKFVSPRDDSLVVVDVDVDVAVAVVVDDDVVVFDVVAFYV
jgi:hypothetical protein